MTQNDNLIQFDSINDALDFAILREQEAHDFYKEWASRTKNEAIQQVLQEFAEIERKHKQLLQNVKKGADIELGRHKVIDLKIGDYFAETKPSAEMTYQDSVRVAIQREMGSQELYGHLASISQESKIKAIFEQLEREEAKHKKHFEKLYDEEFLKEN